MTQEKTEAAGPVPYKNLTAADSRNDSSKLPRWARGEKVVSKLKIIVTIALLLILITIILILAVVLAQTKAKLQKGDKNAIVLNPSPSASTNPIPTTPGTEAWWNFRLPTNVIPNNYDLYLDVNMKKKNYTGSVNILVTVTQSTDLVILHCKGSLRVTQVVVIDKDSAYRPIRQRFQFEKNQYYVIRMSRELTPGQYSLQVTFNGLLGDEVGLFVGNYKIADNATRSYVASQFGPAEARSVFPCFDEPAFKATFNLTISFESTMDMAMHNYQVISNMPAVSTVGKNGKLFAYFATTPKMSTYLLGIVISDFVPTLIRTSDNVPLSFYTETSQSDKGGFALDLTHKVIPILSSYFGIRFPLQKMDFVALNDFSHDMMENWGIGMLQEKYVLWSKANSASEDQRAIGIDTTTLLVHQWLGNLVTFKWWNDFWLYKGLTYHVMGKALSSLKPTWQIPEDYFVELVREAFEEDGYASSRPLRMNVTSYDDMEDVTGFLSDSKGGAVIGMLEDYLGAVAYQNGLKRFLTQNAYGNADAEDLWKVLRNASCATGSCVDVKKMMDTWTLQMGFPVVSVKRDGSSKYSVSQKRFLFDNRTQSTGDPSPYNYLWSIPVTYITSRQSQKTTLTLDGKVGSITWSGEDWIKANYRHKGFYLVEYDNANWDNLAAQLKANYSVFDTADRAGLVQDLSFLARGGIAKYSRLLAMTEYMQNETEFVPWKAFDRSIGDITRYLPPTSQTYKNMKKYTWFQVKKKYFQLGFVDTGSTMERLLREVIVGLACSCGEVTCVNNATAMFQAWMANSTANPIPPNFRHLVYSYGVAYGGVKEWDFAFKQYKTIKDATAKDAILHGLFGTKVTWILRRFLDYAVDPSQIKQEETLHVIGDIALHNSVGRQLAWEFVTKNWGLIMSRYGKSDRMEWMIESLTRGFSSTYELQMLKAFAFNKMHSGIVRSSFKKAVEKVTARIDWLKTNEADIAEWLNRFVHVNNL